MMGDATRLGEAALAAAPPASGRPAGVIAYDDRVALRREAHDLKEGVDLLSDHLAGLDGFEEAADAVRRARLALFEAWTILCFPPDEDDDEEH
jgi:hypothetical protein